MTIIEERLAMLDTIRLAAGGHDADDGRMCVMEAAAWVAGEEWADHPACVSAVIGAFMRRWNDDLDDEGRQRLKAFVPRVIGTAGDGQDDVRGWLAADWLVRVHTPAWLDLAGLASAAAALRALPDLRGSGSVKTAQPALDDARKQARAAARDAAWDATWDAAWDAARAAAGAAAAAAARAAAWDAAGDAAGDAAWAAAGDAAWAAAWDAAGDAAGAAAGDAARDAAAAAAWDAAGDALTPTVAELQASALILLDRMIDVEQTGRRDKELP